MANDKRRSQKVKDDEINKSKKRKVTEDATTASISRRLSRETSSRKQKKESPTKEIPSNTRRSERLVKNKPSDTTPIKKKSDKSQQKTITTPLKRLDRRKKSAEEAALPNLRSKKGKTVKSLKQRLIDTSKDKKHEKQGLDVKTEAGGRKRKRGTTSVMPSSKPQQIKTESDDHNDKESQESSSEDNSRTISDADTEVEKQEESSQLDNSQNGCTGSKSVEDKDDSDDECSDRSGQESNPKGSKVQCETSHIKEPLNDTTCTSNLCDTSSFKDRTTCEAGLTEVAEKTNGVKNVKSSVSVVSGVIESIWDTREVEVSDAKGSQKQKQYFLKYKGLAHIHNQWVTETQLLLEAPLLVENYVKDGLMRWSEEWTVPHKLLNKRLLLSLKPLTESQQNTCKVLNHHYEWLVQWRGLDYEQATWESEDTSVLNSPEGKDLIKEYENLHGNTIISALSDYKTEEKQVELPPIAGPPGMDNIHIGYVKNLHDAWNKGQNSIVFDGQERTMRIVLFIFSLKDVTLPFLLIATPDSLSQWEAMFLKIAPCNALKVSLEKTDDNRSSRLLQVQKEGGQLAFQVLLYPVDAFVKDSNVLNLIKWEAVIVDESQSSEISGHFSHIKGLSTNKRLLVFCGLLGMSMTSYLDVLSLLDCDVISKTELDDLSKLKETFQKCIAYECKSSSSKFVEFWVPVQISNVQLEQYCSTLLSNTMALSSCSKSDTVGAVRDILVSNRKCCDHPYIVDQNLQGVLTKDLELAKFLDVGIKASGKLQFLDKILPELRKRQLRVLILFQPLSGSGKDSTSIGDILDDFLRQRFGENSYERVDGIGIIPSKKQSALNNFNDKDMGRFVFLLEQRACHSSIKLSSVDIIIIFDSEWNPAGDLKALNRITIDSNSEQIMVFRLYTSSTLEERILKLAEHNVTIDSKLQNLSRSTSDDLLMWGARYLFNKLDEFHNHDASVVNISSEEGWLTGLVEDLLNLISHKFENKDASKFIVTQFQPICGAYGKNLPLPNKSNEPSHTFWKKLLVGRSPCWKYLSRSTSRQRKRSQYLEESPKKSNVVNDDVARKRKKTANNNMETVASKPVIVIEEGEVAGDSKVPSKDGSQSPPGDGINNEMTFHDLLKLEISKLCEVLGLSVDVKIMVQRFLEYVIENYRVNKEPTSTVNAFLISLCWIGSAMLKHKLDRSQSVALANEHLNFVCKEEEANSVYLKLEPAKELFLQHIDNQKEIHVSIDSLQSLDPEVKEEVKSPDNQHDNDAVILAEHVKSSDCNQKDAEGDLEVQNDSPCAGVLEEPVASIQALVSPACGQSDPTDNAVEGNPNPSPLPEIGNLRITEEANTPVGEQQPDSDTQNPEPPQVLETSARVPNRTAIPPQSNVSNGLTFGNRIRVPSRTSSSDPLQAEMEKLFELNNVVMKCHEAIKVNLKSEHEKELAEMTARINRKYEAKNKEADAACQLKKKEIDICLHRVVKNKILAETFRSKCQDLTPINPNEIQGGMQHLPQFQNQHSLGGSNAYSPARSSGSQQVTESQPPLRIVHQTSNLFSTTPRRPPFTTSTPNRPQQSAAIPTGTPPSRPPQSTSIPTIPATRPPPSTVIPTGTPTRPPPSTTTPTTTPTRAPQSTAIPTSAPTRPPPSTTIPTSTPTRAPPPPSSNAIPTTTPTRPPPSAAIPTSTPTMPPPSAAIPTSAPTRPPPSTATPTSTPTRPPPSTATPTSIPVRPPSPSVNPITPYNRSIKPPPNINTTTPFPRNPRLITEIRAPAPHIQPFRSSTSVSPNDLTSHRVMSPQHASSNLPPLQKPPPHFPANHHTQNSPRSLPSPPSLVTQASSQPPVAPPVSLHLPTTSSSHPQLPLPPMPSVSISHTGLYSASGRPTPDIYSQRALDLLMDMDKQARLRHPNAFPSPPGFLNLADFGKEGGGGDGELVCLSDDD